MTSAVTDFAQYNRMRLDANAENPAVLREVAGQFESLFVESLLKNMRESSLGDPIFGQNDQHKMYQGMLDQQFAVEMSKGRGLGIADMLVRQLGGEAADLPVPANTTEQFPVISRSRTRRWPESGELAATGSTAVAANWASPADFAKDLWPHAERAGKALGVAPQALLAQAALETGWGAHVMNRPDGSSSFNVFGIKAEAGWDGANVVKSTLEFDRGIAHRELAKFRAYPDIAATFDDYTAFIGDRPRYALVRGAGADINQFATALQSAGYATDPDYAGKIDRIANGNTMQTVLKTLKAEQALPTNSLSSRVSHQ